MIYSYYEHTSEWFEDWGCRRVVVRTKDRIDDPILFMHEVLNDLMDKYNIPDRCVVHIKLTSMDNTLGFTISKTNEGEVINPPLIRQYDFLNNELVTLAEKLLQSDDSWEINDRTLFTVNIFFPPEYNSVTYVKNSRTHEPLEEPSRRRRKVKK